MGELEYFSVCHMNFDLLKTESCHCVKFLLDNLGCHRWRQNNWHYDDSVKLMKNIHVINCSFKWFIHDVNLKLVNHSELKFWPLVTKHDIWTFFIGFNSLWPSDTIWRQRSGSSLAQVMACCLIAPWWRHQMETFSALLAICVGNPSTKASDMELWNWCFLWSLPE